MGSNTTGSKLTIKNFSFCYPQSGIYTLNGIDLSVKPGEFIVLCGPSGCGKTTLLRQCKPALAAHGTKSGAIFLDDTELKNLSDRDASAKIGFVQQNPDNQIVTDKVWHELAFGLESLGCDTPTIRLRVAEMASFFGIEKWFHRSVNELSGGQKQLLALASTMVMQPSLLILDEPTAQLDPIAASEFISTVGKINRELGITVIMTEHRLEEAFPLCTRAVVMDKGRIICTDTPSEAGEFLRISNHKMFFAMPTPMRIWAGVKSNLPCPVTIQEGREWLSKSEIKKPVSDRNIIRPRTIPSVELDDVWFKYSKDSPDIVKGLAFSAYPGEVTAILGGNGTGKTTTLSLISGLNKPYRGRVRINGNELGKIPTSVLFDRLLGVLPQNPQTLFTAKTVKEDLEEILSDFKLSKHACEQKISKVAALCRLSDLLFSHPYDLSGGEQQRAALAKVLISEPKILLLDEPTKGLDADFKQTFADILHALTASGVAIIMVSHDIEFCAEYADRCALFFDGGIVSDGAPQEFFSGNSFYTSSANRMSRHLLPKAVTAADVISALGETPPYKSNTPPIDNTMSLPAPTTPVTTVTKSPIKTHKLSKRTLAAAIIILLAIPITIFIGIFCFGDRKYNFISLLVILESMIPFALIFESRNPQAKELVILAVLTAIAVAGRAAFFMLPQFKPVAAMVIITGVAFGGESGFLVGALSGFISNMIFGQGPWTPWQMFAFGIIGFLAGVLSKKGSFSRNRIALCIFGGLSTFFIYGGLMNASSVVTYQSYPTKEIFLAAYLHGIPFDLIHAVATVFFLAVISRPMLEKLDRIKIKYGLIEVSQDVRQ